MRRAWIPTPLESIPSCLSWKDLGQSLTMFAAFLLSGPALQHWAAVRASLSAERFGEKGKGVNRYISQAWAERRAGLDERETIQIITCPFKWHFFSSPLFSHFKVCKYLDIFLSPLTYLSSSQFSTWNLSNTLHLNSLHWEGNLDQELDYPTLSQVYLTDAVLKSQACSFFDRETAKWLTNQVIWVI